MNKKLKIIAVLILAFFFFILGLYLYMLALSVSPDRNIQWGITFSQKFSMGLGLNWKENFKAILNDLGVKHLRLVAYWDLIESQQGKYNFQDLDYQVKEAEKYGANFILVVGQKVPRWPECHYPQWVGSLSKDKKDKALLSYISTVVKHYKNSPKLLYWQVENEPFLPFGECPSLDKKFLGEKIKLVKSLDPNHQILMTDSGELGLWYSAAKRGDIFGTTIYRRVYNKIFGYVNYHLSPGFFPLKGKITRFLIGDYQKKFLVSELAAEPWLKQKLSEASIEEQFKYFDLIFFKDTIDYAKKTGFDEYYLWGAEWWYYLKVHKSHPEFWNEAKKLF